MIMFNYTKLNQLKQTLDSYRPLPPEIVSNLHEDLVLRWTYNSNAIEGNTLTLQETALVLEGVTIDKKPLKEHLEAIGHRDAFCYLEQIIKRKEPLSEHFIKELHSLVLMDRPEDKGTYRRIPVRILGAAHTPPQPYLVGPEMERLIRETATSRVHPIEAAALFHIHFETVHPFIDGNGRTGRLLMNFMLMQNGYPPVNIKFADRRRYYEAFTAYHKDDNATPMIRLIADYLCERLNEYLEMLVR
jgi:Fic family protein